MPKLSLVIPTLNEAKAIPRVLSMLRELRESDAFSREFSGLEVIVVDDGSSDDSQQILQAEKDIVYLRHSVRHGYGAALKTGFARATGDLIYFIDMDASYDPRDVLKLFATMQETGADVVFGNRLSHRSGMPWIRTLGNRFFSILAHRLAGSPVADVCTGFRLFRREHLPIILSVTEKELNYSMALTLRLIRSNLKLAECPIQYNEREGRSKLNVVEDGFAFLTCILKSRYG